MTDTPLYDQWKQKQVVGSQQSSSIAPTPTPLYDQWKNKETQTLSTGAFSSKDPEILARTVMGLIPGSTYAAESVKKQYDIMTGKRKDEGDFLKDMLKLPVEAGKDVWNLAKGLPGFVAGAVGTPVLTASEAVGGPKEVDLGPLGKLESFQQQRKGLKEAGAGEVVSDVLPTAQWLLSLLSGKHIVSEGKKLLTKQPPVEGGVSLTVPEKTAQGQLKQKPQLLTEEEALLNLMKNKVESSPQSIAEADRIINKYLEKVSTEPRKPVKKTFQERFDDLYTNVVDRLNPITKAQEGTKVPIGEDVRLLTRRYYGVEGIARGKIEGKGTFKLDPVTGEAIYNGPSFKSVVEPFKKEIEAVRALFTAEREVEIGLQGKKGANVGEAQNTINALRIKYGDRFPELQNTTKGIRDFLWKANIEPLLEVGAISPETAAKFKQSGQFYAPFKRVMEEVDSQGYVPKNSNIFNPQSVPIKRMKGSERNIVDPLESVITDTYKITDFVERARVSKALVGLRKFSPDLAETIKEVKPKMVPVAKEMLKAEIDQPFMDRLIEFGKELGLKEFETKGQVGRTLGWYSSAAKKIVRKFATSRETLSHEVGHFFDDVFKIKQKFYKRGNTKAVAEEMSNFMEKQGQKAYRIAKPEERFAHSFEWWLTHRDLAQQQLPLFSKAMKNIIINEPKLKGLLDVKPTPGGRIETQTKTIFRPSRLAPEKNTLTVFEDGDRKFYQVPEDIYKAMTGVNQSDMGMIMKILSVPAKVLRAGATLAPEFTVRNPIRDQFSAFVYSKYGFTPGVDFVKGLFSSVGKDNSYWEWVGQGGEHSMLVSLDRLTSKTTLNEVLGKKRGLLNVVTHPLDALQKLSEWTESGTRLGLYKKARTKGASTLEAVYEAREGTLDFARIGSETRAMNSITAFFNANIQGLDKMVRAFKERPGTTTFKAVAGITVPSLILYALNKDNPRYKELPQWQKDFFWIVIPPGEKSPIIRIPKPFELGILFGTVPEHIAEYINSKDPEALKNTIDPILSGLPNFRPTAAQPLLELWANKSFFTGRPIIGQTEKGLPPEMQYKEYTSEIAKELGKISKKSPDKIQYLWEAYTSSLGKATLQYADEIFKKIKGGNLPPEPEKTLSDIPGVVRAFVAREPIGSQSESVNKFYDMLEKSRTANMGLKDLAEKGLGQTIPGYIKSRPELFLNKGLEEGARTFSELRKTKDTIYANMNMTPKEKRAAITKIDTLMTDLARKYITVYSSILKNYIK